ncbi:MAG: Crp/Fnr family transcriptional regulator [Anaerolineae bacterium]
MYLREFQRGETLFWEGDPCAGLHIIEEGSVKLYLLSPQGRQYIVRVLEEGETCNEVPAFNGGTNPVNVDALEYCRVWVVEAEILRRLVLAHPHFALKVLNHFGQNLRKLVHMVGELAFYQVTHRLARLLAEMPTSEGQEISTYWTQEQLAARLGTVREVVARSLKELERSGAIRLEDRRIRIVDRAILHEWCPPYN